MCKCDIGVDLSFKIRGSFFNNGHVKIYVFLLYQNDRIATFLVQAVKFRSLFHTFNVVPLSSTV